MSWKPVGSLAKPSRIAAVAPSSRTDLGNVTLEVSATTLSAKIYANEGAAQMLFFQQAPMPTRRHLTAALRNA